MIALLGTTGKIGGAALRFLQQQQVPVRAVTRAQADMRDPEALGSALQGAEAILTLLPFDFNSLQALQASLLQTLGQLRPAHFLFISDYGAHHPEGTGIPAIFHQIEKQLLDLKLPCTILRSAEHMQNWLRPGQANFYPPDTPPRPFVSAYDVGEIAARLLLEPPPPGSRILHAEGPRRYPLSELARFPQASPEAAGLPEALARVLSETYRAHGQGLIEVEPGGKVLRGPTELSEVLQNL
ncbi:hypothetical protein ABS71_05015 [bacterium SCN 62-11]|nr:NmrA family transcriptional regulator [Candidatus Eremiobacteraeota bacterium]ODT74958.1 MAG: hypothetical protein ABS71_05015 [bacterium SCN 62-11]